MLSEQRARPSHPHSAWVWHSGMPAHAQTPPGSQQGTRTWRAAGRKGLTDGLRPTAGQRKIPCEPGPAHYPGLGDHSVEERAPRTLRLSSAHWSWTLALLALRDRCCKRKETPELGVLRDRTSQCPHTQPKPPSGSHLLSRRHAPRATIWREKAQVTDKGDGPALGRHSSPWTSPPRPRLLTEGSAGRCRWNTLSLCPSPWDSTAATPSVLRGLGSGCRSLHVSRNFLQMVKERYPPLRNKEIHHFTKHLRVQVRVLGALTPVHPLASVRAGKAHRKRTPFFPFRNVAPPTSTTYDVRHHHGHRMIDLGFPSDLMF